jgi:hypothetical protein
VIVTNVIGAISGAGSQLFRAVYRTYRAAFPSVALHPVGHPADGQGVRNLILVASDDRAPGKAELARRAKRRRERVPAAPDLQTAIRDRWDRPVSFSGVPVLTDDYAPTDALLAD